MKFIFVWIMIIAATYGFVQEPVPQLPQDPPKFDLDQYQFGMLERGAKWTPETTPETQKIQDGHMANIKRMAEMGKLVAAGPMVGNGDLRGIFIFKASSLKEAESLAAQDPAIQAGRLRLRLMNWWAPKGIGVRLLAEIKSNPNPKYTMAPYYLAFLKKGPEWTATSSPETLRLQTAHLWDIRRKLDARNYVSAGPLESDVQLGIFVIAAESVEQAMTIAQSDPAVKAGRFVIEMHTWYVASEVWQ